MAAVASAADQATELLKKLAMEPKNKTHEGHEVAMKPSGLQYGSANGVEAPKFQMPLSERSVTPVLPEYVDNNICCYFPNGYQSTGYYYGAYDGSVNEWDYSRYAEGLEVPHGVYNDMYHHGYGYAPYSAYQSCGSPVPSMGHDGHIYGAQHYQYPSPYFQPQTDMNGTYSFNKSDTQPDINATAVADKPPVIVESVKSNSTEVNNGNANGHKDFVPLKQSQQNSQSTCNGTYGRGVLVGGHPSSGYQDPRFSYDSFQSPNSWFDGPAYSDPYSRSTTPNAAFSAAPHNSNLESSRNLNACSVPQLMGFNAARPTPMGPTAHGIMNRMYPANQMYGHCANAYKSGFGFGSNMYDSRMNDRWGMSFDGKYKPRGRGNGFYGYGNENIDGLSELNRGPRANRFKNYKGPVPEDPSVVPDREQYNRADFSDEYIEAKFFVIKSYSEDDVHKSIKYNVWASTPNGNKKLDAAYKEAKDKGVECPVFLLFSVNTSGQFIGVAEMVGPVDFNKTVDYWQQDKWNGCFNVKWHIVKDVPNSILKHIIIESNDNKPVTNSRDTQEVKLEQGLHMLKIFKEHISKTSILDDFGFYESRQKVMQEKRFKQPLLLKPMVEVKPANPVNEKGKDDESTVNGGLQKPPSEPVTVVKKEAVSVVLSEQKQCDDDDRLPPADSDDKKVKPVMVSNGGTVNAC